MKLTKISIAVSFSVLTTFWLPGCATRSEVIEMGSNRYSVYVKGHAFQVGASLYEDFQKKAGEVCKGKFKVVSQQYIHHPAE